VGRSVLEAELAGTVPVIRATVGGTRIVGRLCVGNKNGLLLPHTITDQGTRCRCLSCDSCTCFDLSIDCNWIVSVVYLITQLGSVCFFVSLRIGD
jgi:hypothetical protein